jgi:shikimate dehydrogenase
MGGTDRYVLFGHPVGHSWSPFIHRMFAQQFGHEIDYGLVDVEPERFASVVRQFFGGGGRGANITVPHKLAAAGLADELTARAVRAGAVNTLAARSDQGLLGDNTDGAGLIADLTRNLEVTLRDRRLLILGAGGAARGVLAPLLAEKPAQVLVANRTAERARALAAAFADLGEVAGGGFAAAAQGDWDLVINATSAGLHGQAPELPAGTLGPDSVCYDMAYARGETPFQRWAANHGARQIHQGWGMLIEQAAEAYLLWRGTRPDTGPVRAAIVTS